MLRSLSLQRRSFALRAPFRISRGVKQAAEVVTVELGQSGKTGRGESVPYPRYGESVTSVIDQVETLRAELIAGMGRDELQQRLPAGAARNAIDCALWDLEARLHSTSVSSLLAHPPPPARTTALTVSLDTPERMGEAAAAMVNARLIKIKVGADAPGERIEAVRRAAPAARIIVDANESWNIDLLRDSLPVLEQAKVDLLEQPLPADDDDNLLALSCGIPICADEACHTRADLPRLRGRYQAVNIKLDKTGGLTEAWRLLHAARSAGFEIMLGCMVGSSLGIAPAFELAGEASFVDLDGPLWLQHDYPQGVRLQNGRLMPPQAGFWGGDS